MSVTHPSPKKIEALERRWEGEEHRLRAIARDLRAGRDWTVHLRGLPYTDEIPPVPGEALGRDLRGADLHHDLRPDVTVERAEEHESPLVAAISLEALRNNTPLPDVSPFPVEVEGAGEIGLAMRRGERFYLARCDREPVGTVRAAGRREFEEHTGQRAYLELSGLGVLGRWRRSGIGSQLIEAIEALAIEEGYEYVLLRTTREIGLVPWYEKKGYRTALTRQLSYPDAPTCLDVVMTKAVTAPTIPPAKRHKAYRRPGPAGSLRSSGLPHHGTSEADAYPR